MKRTFLSSALVGCCLVFTLLFRMPSSLAAVSDDTVSGNSAADGNGTVNVSGTAAGNEASNGNGTAVGNEASNGSGTAAGNKATDGSGAAAGNGAVGGSSAATVSGGNRGVVFSLQVPDNLDFMIDPFEINGRGQIFSKRYCIKNSGAAPVTVDLANIHCSVEEGSNIEFYSENKPELKESGDKAVCMELRFENGTVLALSEQPAEYQAVLGPGEELAFTFAGAVNENSAERWYAGDIHVSVTYSALEADSRQAVQQDGFDGSVSDSDAGK